MTGRDFMKSPWLYVEIGPRTMKVLNGEGALDFPLERQENGRLTQLCREQLTRRLQGILHRKRWQPRMRALCAIGARGVSLRRLTLPSAPNEEFHRLLRLQIESEFPLPPDQLAWGYRRVGADGAMSNGGNSRQELVVVAVKREFLEEYWDIFSECGVNPVFTLTAFTRGRIGPQRSGSYAVLDIGDSHSEWISYENGAPNSLRILAWGRENITRALEQRLGISRGEAEQMNLNLDPRNTLDEETRQKVQDTVEPEMDSLAESIRSAWTGQKIYLTGKIARDLDLARRLVERLGNGAACEPWEDPTRDRSAVVSGLEQNGAENAERLPLLIQFDEAKSGEALSKPAPWKWAALVVLLAMGVISLPYAEAFVMKSRLSRRLEALKVEKQRLPAIDRELQFLQYLKDNQPPYLEALAVVANAAPPGTRFDSVSMTRRGDVALRGFMRDSQQVVDFRSKLISSGFFSNVVVEEQNPTPDRQRINLRISAQFKSAPGRESLPAIPTALAAAEIQKPKVPAQEVRSNAPPEKAAPVRAAVASTNSSPPPRPAITYE